MWILRAAFDDADGEDTKEKLLLPGVEYAYGRRRGPGDPDNKLFTKSKVISRTEGFFIVSELPVSGVP
ncbi:uncharacterized protein EI90DRAFT_1902683 [Cantharellus anzutake]|uniref:uncharacterized protein n=1 Tax=Cantharellus anzutake TaxID=1750568 RepID=UPI0019046B4F|nr:uncharacterized protein EI90DRAFT_1902683 [Cantharellus anzutake]KAF8326538.1 hypothetical protein EI90DRAFT_1902683 [Cantharellus anzutake]